MAIARDASGAALVHLKSETDFAAKSDDFRKMTQELADLVLASGPEAISAKDAEMEDLKLTVKENLEVGAVVRFEAAAGSEIDAYLHGDGRAGVLIEAQGVSPELLHEIALHIAFAKPTFLQRSDVPADEVEKERATLLEITKKEGKPEQAWPKIVEGRLDAWFGDRVLLEQGVFGEKETVKAKIGAGTISRFVLAMVGG